MNSNGGIQLKRHRYEFRYLEHIGGMLLEQSINRITLHQQVDNLLFRFLSLFSFPLKIPEKCGVFEGKSPPISRFPSQLFAYRHLAFFNLSLFSLFVPFFTCTSGKKANC